MSLLEVENMRVRYGAYEVLKGVNFALREGEWLMVIGPNGAGKSTIVKAVSQSTPYTGQVLFAGEDVRQMRPSYLARRLGVLMQNHAVGYSFTVEEVVGLGRYAYSRGVFGGKSEEDQARVERALVLTGLLAQRHQSVLTLSMTMFSNSSWLCRRPLYFNVYWKVWLPRSPNEPGAASIFCSARAVEISVGIKWY